MFLQPTVAKNADDDNAQADFYIVAEEPGAEHPAIPTWANRSSNPASLSSEARQAVERVEIENVPGTFQLHNMLSTGECRRLQSITESLGYLPDAAVSLPRSIRHNHSATWVVDDATVDIIWRRCASWMADKHNWHFGKKPLGLNQRFRFYRYEPGDYFKPHTDGAWPGSKVVDEKLVANGFADRWSQLTFLLFLTDDYEGGRTQFYTTNAPQPFDDDNRVDVTTPMGTALCFPHGMHPLHCLHGSEEIKSGAKYIIRSDVLFEL